MTSKLKVSPAIFIASILCFLLPFVTVSCGGQKVASFSGIQLATGTAVEQPQMFGPPQKQKVDPDPSAVVAALAAIAGLGLSFLGARTALGPAVSGGIGAISLLFMKSRLDDQIVKQGHGMLQVNYETGFSLTLLLLLAGAAWNAYLFSQREQIPAQANRTEGSRQVSLADSGLTRASCPHCGQPWPTNAKFCTNCGKSASGSAVAHV